MEAEERTPRIRMNGDCTLSQPTSALSQAPHAHRPVVPLNAGSVCFVGKRIEKRAWESKEKSGEGSREEQTLSSTLPMVLI